jgi:hypothetical protein
VSTVAGVVERGQPKRVCRRMSEFFLHIDVRECDNEVSNKANRNNPPKGPLNMGSFRAFEAVDSLDTTGGPSQGH